MKQKLVKNLIIGMIAMSSCFVAQSFVGSNQTLAMNYEQVEAMSNLSYNKTPASNSFDFKIDLVNEYGESSNKQIYTGIRGKDLGDYQTKTKTFEDVFVSGYLNGDDVAKNLFNALLETQVEYKEYKQFFMGKTKGLVEDLIEEILKARDPNFEYSDYGRVIKNWAISNEVKEYTPVEGIEYRLGNMKSYATEMKELNSKLEKFGFTKENLLEDARNFVRMYGIEGFDKSELCCRKIVLGFANYLYHKYVTEDFKTCKD